MKITRTTPNASRLLMGDEGNDLNGFDAFGNVVPLTLSGPERYRAGKLAGYENPWTAQFNASKYTIDDRNSSGNAMTVTGVQRVGPGKNGRINLIWNPSFENTDMSYWTTHSLNVNISHATDRSVFGSTSARVVCMADINFGQYIITHLNNMIRTNPGSTYIASAYIYNDAPTTRTIYFNLGERTWAGANGPTSGASVDIPAKQWTRVSRTITTSGAYDALYFQIHMLSSAASPANPWQIGESMYVDGVLVEPSSTLNDYFDGTFTGAAWTDPRTLVVGTAHNSPSVSRAAVYVDDAVTNLLPNPSTETNLTSIAANASTVTRVQDCAYVGSWATKIVTPNGINQEGVVYSTNTGLAYTGTNPYSGTIYARGSGNVSMWLRVGYTDATLADGTAVNVTLTNAWQKIACSVTPNGAKTVNYVQVFVVTNGQQGITFYTDAAMVTQTLLARSPQYVDGSLGTGFSWSGTAHASTSSHAASATNSYTLQQGRVSSRKGALAFTFNGLDETSSVNPLGRRLVTIGNANTGSNQLIAGFNGSTQQFELNLNSSASGSGYVSQVTSGTVNAANTWYTVYMEWDYDTNVSKIVVNGVTTTGTYATVRPELGWTEDYISIGAYAFASQTGKGLIGDVMFFDQPLNAACISQLMSTTEVWSKDVLDDCRNKTFEAQPRINLCKNPSFETNTTGWSVSAGTMTRITNDSTQGTACLENTASTISSDGVFTTGLSALQNIQSADSAFTISFDAKLMSGGNDWQLYVQEKKADGSAFNTVLCTNFTPTSSWKRFVGTYVPANGGTHYISLWFRRATATTSTIRLDGFVIEAGMPPDATYFDGNSAYAQWADPFTGIKGTAHASASVSHAAHILEELTTNRLLNPSVENAISFPQIYNLGAGATLSQDSLYAVLGTKSVKITAAGSGPTEGVRFQSATGLGNTGSSIPFAGRARVRGTGTVTVDVTIIYTDTNFTTVQSSVVYLNNAWQDISGIIANTNASKTVDTVNLDVRTVGTQAATFYVDCAQVEQNSVSTSYVDGSLGSGYSWNGTANASSSARSGSLIRFNVSLLPNLSTIVGSVSFWVNISTAKFGRVFDLGNWGASPGDHFDLTYQSPSISADSTIDGVNAADANAGTLTLNRWHHVYGEWNGTSFGMRLNGGSLFSSTRNTPVGFVTPAAPYVAWGGQAGSGGQAMNGLIQGAAVYNRVLSAGEVTALYNSRDFPSANREYSTRPTITRTRSVPRVVRTTKAASSPALLAVNGLLGGMDAFGPVTGTGSGALRYVPGPHPNAGGSGARVNYALNPSLTVNSTGYGAETGGHSVARVTDAAFNGGFALEVVGAADTVGAAFSMNGGIGGSIEAMQVLKPITVSFDVRWISGATDWSIEIQERTAGNSGVGAVNQFFGNYSDSAVRRFSYTLVPNQATFSHISFKIRRGSVAAGTMRISNIQVEYSSAATPFVSGAQGGTWWNVIANTAGTANASSSVSDLAVFKSEGRTFDGRMTAEMGGRVNYFTNPSFENALSGGEVAADGGAGIVFSRDTTVSYAGASSLKITNPGTLLGSSVVISVFGSINGGQQLRGKHVWARCVFKGSGDAIKFYLGSWFGGYTGATFAATQTITPTNNWQEVIIGPYLVPANYDRISFALANNVLNKAHTAWVDEVIITDHYPAPYFDGSYPQAQWMNPLKGTIGTAHNSPSVSSVAFFTEESTTNLVLNPSTEVNLTNISLVSQWNGDPAGNQAITQDLASPVFGNYGAKVVTTNVGLYEGIAYNTAAPNGATTPRTFTGSVYVRGTAGTVVTIGVRAWVNGGAAARDATSIVALQEYWQRFSVSVTTNNGDVLNGSISLFVARNWGTARGATTYWTDGGQIEEKAYATTYVDGDFGTGYSWNGAGHASTSSRASITNTQFPVANHVNTDKGSLLFWYQRPYRSTTTQHYMFSFGANGVGVDHVRARSDIAADQYQAFYVANSFNSSLPAAPMPPAGRWDIYYFEWEGSAFRTWNILAGWVSTTRVAPAATMSGPIVLDAFNTSSDAVAGYHGPFLIFNRPLTMEEIQTFKRGDWSPSVRALSDTRVSVLRTTR